MITKSFSDTSGSLGYIQPQRDKYKTPIDKIRDTIVERRAAQKAEKTAKEIEAIKSKPIESLSLEDKIKLAHYYGKNVYEKLADIDPRKYSTVA